MLKRCFKRLSTQYVTYVFYSLCRNKIIGWFNFDILIMRQINSQRYVITVLTRKKHFKCKYFICNVKY